jgi:ATP-dependent exoDNAse (exonuclease V) beta subunit
MLLGRVDLLVLDKYGTPHVIDYKTSPKPYEQYNSAKVLNFTY